MGRESDFDLIMSITESNLDSLIGMKETERGRILSRWIGLLPIEEKDSYARQKYNTEIKPYLLSNKYNSESLKQEKAAFEIKIKTNQQIIDEINKSNKEIDKEIEVLENNKSILIQSKQSVDDNLLKIDISTLNAKIDTVTTDGLKKKYEIENAYSRIKEIGDVDFSVEKYDNAVQELSNLKERRGSLLAKHNNVKHTLEHLKVAKFALYAKEN